MRFLRRNKPQKTVLVISDLHLGAGSLYDHKRNFLEDFHSDSQLVDFLQYFSSGEYASREVEVIINGDFLDFLAVPYVRYFDDEFWSEEAVVEKLKIILEAHREVFEAMEKFLRGDKKKIVYIIGNHDGELILPKVREHFISIFSDSVKKSIEIKMDLNGEYWPLPGILIKHGHEYELAHQFHIVDSVVMNEEKKRYFIPPWGSYYVTRVVNRFKQDRSYINAVRPVKKFLIHGLAYDTLFTMRFMFASFFYFVMVRFIYTFRQGNGFKAISDKLKQELKLFQNYENMTENFLLENDNVKALIVGHSHDPCYRVYANGSVFINTGTWTRMINLDFDKRNNNEILTFAQIDVLPEENRQANNARSSQYDIGLHVWKGLNSLPYQEYTF